MFLLLFSMLRSYNKPTATRSSVNKVYKGRYQKNEAYRAVFQTVGSSKKNT